MGDLASHIADWQAAGLIDAETAERLLATIPLDADGDTDEDRPQPTPHAGSFSGVLGPSVQVSEAFTYLGIAFLAAAWTAFLSSLAVGADDSEAIWLIGTLLSAVVFAGMFLVLRRGDDRWRRGAGVAAFVSTSYAAAAMWILTERFLDGNLPLALVVSGAATTAVAVLFRMALPSLTTQFTVLISATSLAVVLLEFARSSFFGDAPTDLPSAKDQAFVQVILEAAWWAVIAIGLGLVGLREARDPDDAPAMRRAGLTRLWAGLTLVIGVSLALTRSMPDPASFEFRRIIEPWIADLIIIAISIVLIERALRRGSGAFLVGGALGMIIALTDLNTSYLTDSVEAGLLIEGVILLSIGFAANRLRGRLDRGTEQRDAAEPGDPFEDAGALDATEIVVVDPRDPPAV